MVRGILEDFEISLAVLLPNTTTGYAITYNNILRVRGRPCNLPALNSSVESQSNFNFQVSLV